jgi:GT2 family glycosyltransferase
MRCSIAVVTFNGWPHTYDCLCAIERELAPGIDLVVVDNASSDGTPERIRSAFPSVRLIQSGSNLGFAAGANLAIRESQGEIVLLLNSDVVIEPGFVDAMLAPFEQSSAIGGAAAYRRAALDDVGLFSDAFFMYLEDVDLAWRLRLRGWETVLAVDAVAAHAVSASAGEGSAFKRRLLARNRVWTIIRCLPDWMLLRSGWRIARYDGLVLLSAPVRRDLASATGRVAALNGIRTRLAERRSIQARSTVSRADIERWLRPEPSAAELVRIRRRVRALAGE